MKVIQKPNQPTNFISFYQANAEEKIALLKFLLFCEKNNIREKILTHQKFAPAGIWKNWVDSTYVGFSGNSVLLKSGHRFFNSYTVHLKESYTEEVIVSNHPRISFKDYIKGLLSKPEDPEKAPSEKSAYLDKFRQLYPDYQKIELHSVLEELHPTPFLRALEVYELSEYASPKHVFEIGAGACVKALMNLSQHSCKYTILDLPDTIMVGYSFLKTVMPSLKIALPQDIGEEWNPENYDVSFMCPSQESYLPRDYYDLAINTSSFQEMEQGVVNNYLDLIQSILRPQVGNIVLCNQVVSKHIEGNQFTNYCLDQFDQKRYCSAPLHNWENRHFENLKQFFYQGQKR